MPKYARASFACNDSLQAGSPQTPAAVAFRGPFCRLERQGGPQFMPERFNTRKGTRDVREAAPDTREATSERSRSCIAHGSGTRNDTATRLKLVSASIMMHRSDAPKIFGC
jgi:hypothetical protein